MDDFKSQYKTTFTFLFVACSAEGAEFNKAGMAIVATILAIGFVAGYLTAIL